MPINSNKSDSGYGDNDVSRASISSSFQDHPLAKKGYEIRAASSIEVGDVFEFLWADAVEFEWEWKCLGYVRFIALRHNETFPHHCVCIPISVGAKHNFAKPGIDSSQHGFVFDDNSSDQWVEKMEERHRLYYPPVGVELKSSRFRVKENSRANYADIIEVDHEAMIVVVGTVARYFDRVRRSVNKAVMRDTLKKALAKYREKRDQASGEPPKIEPSVVGQTFEDESPDEASKTNHSVANQPTKDDPMQELEDSIEDMCEVARATMRNL